MKEQGIRSASQQQKPARQINNNRSKMGHD